MAHVRRRVLLCLSAAVVFLLLAGGLVTAAPPDDAAKGPPQMGKIVSIHYPRGLEAKGGEPGSPVKPPKPDGDAKAWFKYSGIHWTASSVDYVVNTDNCTTANSTFVPAVDAAFDAWEAASTGTPAFRNAGTGPDIPSSFYGDGDANGANEIGWVNISSSYPGAIAVTMTWYWIGNGEIIEVDLAFNAAYPWVQNVVSGDPDMITGTPNYFDVQNIATHEAGHWLMLGDLYNKPARSQTMYGYGSLGELQKRSLESGDVAGVQTIYPS